MFIPTKEYHIEMSPTDFERYALSILRKQFVGKENVENYTMEHNVHIDTYDGTYQIDGLIKFYLLGAAFKVLVECKKYKNSVKREQVQALKGKIDSIGAQKGIFISTSSFQSGALEYARKHGIALITITDGNVIYHTRSDEINKAVRNIGAPYQMAFQRMQTNGSVMISYLNHSDALYKFIIGDKGGEIL